MSTLNSASIPYQNSTSSSVSGDSLLIPSSNPSMSPRLLVALPGLVNIFGAVFTALSNMKTGFQAGMNETLEGWLRMTKPRALARGNSLYTSAIALTLVTHAGLRTTSSGDDATRRSINIFTVLMGSTSYNAAHLVVTAQHKLNAEPTDALKTLCSHSKRFPLLSGIKPALMGNALFLGLAFGFSDNVEKMANDYNRREFKLFGADEKGHAGSIAKYLFCSLIAIGTQPLDSAASFTHRRFIADLAGNPRPGKPSMSEALKTVAKSDTGKLFRGAVPRAAGLCAVVAATTFLEENLTKSKESYTREAGF